ncbi:MAG: hypothetical protein QW728_07785 [Thermoplasmata archaeon]
MKSEQVLKDNDSDKKQKMMYNRFPPAEFVEKIYRKNRAVFVILLLIIGIAIRVGYNIPYHDPKQDFAADTYESRVFLNDYRDAYTKTQIEPRWPENSYFAKPECAPYPPVLLVVLSAIYYGMGGDAVDFYYFSIAFEFITALVLLLYCLMEDRIVPFICYYLNPVSIWFFGYFWHFTMTIFLFFIFSGMTLYRAGFKRAGMFFAGTAIAAKLFNIFLLAQHRVKWIWLTWSAVILGLVVPYFIFDNYLSIFTFHSQRGLRFLMDSFTFTGGKYLAIGLIALLYIGTIGVCLMIKRLEILRNYNTLEIMAGSMLPFAFLMGIQVASNYYILMAMMLPTREVRRNILCFIMGFAGVFYSKNVPVWPWATVASSAVFFGYIVYENLQHSRLFDKTYSFEKEKELWKKYIFGIKPLIE